MGDAARRLTIAIRCDGIATLGVGHVIRQVALAEELSLRGHEVTFHGSCDVPWAREQVTGRGWGYVTPAPDFAAAMRDSGVDAVMIDGYEFPRRLGESLQRVGIPVATMVDAGFGTGQAADLYIDQNLGAVLPEGAKGRWLLGESYVLLRDVVRRLRDRPASPPNQPPRVLIVFGGSDPYGGTPIAAEMLLSNGLPVSIQAISTSEETAAQLRALPLTEGQSIEVLGHVDDLPALAVTCDFAISAAGSSVWEFAALGIPTALVAVADNQEMGYRIATERLCVGLGRLAMLRELIGAQDEAIMSLVALLTDPELRQRIAASARDLIDGRGRERVADAIEELARAA